MEITLPKEVVDSLPDPDGQGMVRVSVAMKLGENGEADIVEVNDVPVPGEDDDESEEDLPDEGSMPSPDDIASQITSAR